MRSDVLDPWMRGRRITLGDKDWEPKDSRLMILEGPELADTDLSLGRGWSSAEKGSENVTRRLVEAATAPAGGPIVAVLAEGSAGADLAADAGAARAETARGPSFERGSSVRRSRPTDPASPLSW